MRSRPWLLVPLLLGGPVYAQPDPPRIHDVLAATGERADRAPLGAVIIVRGRGFGSVDPHARPDELRHVRVRIGHAEAIVLDVEPRSITFLIPPFDVQPGRRRVRIDVAGRGQATFLLELVDPDDWGRGPPEDTAPRLPPPALQLDDLRQAPGSLWELVEVLRGLR